MINLIPNEENKKTRKGFYYRLLVLFLLIISCSLLIGLAAMLPAYFASSVKNNLINEKLAEQKNESMPVFDVQTTLLIKDVNGKLDLVENAEKNKFDVSSQVINAIILKKTPDIKITQITYDDTAAGPIVKVSGVAPSREVLLLFNNALKDDISFKNVSLPISNFIKGSNIQFNLSLIPS